LFARQTPSRRNAVLHLDHSVINALHVMAVLIHFVCKAFQAVYANALFPGDYRCLLPECHNTLREIG